MIDTKGPEIRSGEVENGELNLLEKDQLLLTNKVVIGNKRKITVNYFCSMEINPRTI